MTSRHPTPGGVRALNACAPAHPPADREPELIALVRAARAGDSAAWTRLVERFTPTVRTIARTYRLQPTDIDDVVQATWLRLFNHIDRLRDPSAIAGWLATTARRESLRLLQAPVREQLTNDPLLGDRAEHDGAGTELLAADRRAVLARALATLPDRHRALMTLLASQPDPDYQQISTTLGMPIGSIGPIRARSLARLQRHPELRSLHPNAS